MSRIQTKIDAAEARIEQLEKKIEELEARLGLLEARPHIVGVPGMSGIEFPITQPICTCGTTEVCSLHEAALEVMRVSVP